MERKFTTRKFDGDSAYSWAVFYADSLPRGHRGIVFWGEARPIVCGLSKSEAEFYKKKLSQEN